MALSFCKLGIVYLFHTWISISCRRAFHTPHGSSATSKQIRQLWTSSGSLTKFYLDKAGLVLLLEREELEVELELELELLSASLISPSELAILFQQGARRLSLKIYNRLWFFHPPQRGVVEVNGIWQLKWEETDSFFFLESCSYVMECTPHFLSK